MFLFKGNSTIWFDYRPNKQTKYFLITDILRKTSILMKITKSLRYKCKKRFMD